MPTINVFKKLYEKQKLVGCLFIAIIFVVIVLAFWIFVTRSNLKLLGNAAPDVSITNETKVDDTVWAERVLDDFEFNSLTYYYSELVYAQDVKKLGNIKLPFTEKYTAIQYDGVMKIGINAKDVEIEQTDSTITITMPQAKILSHEEVTDSWKVVIDRDTIFNQNDISESLDIFKQKKKEREQAAVKSGLLDEAETNAEGQLRTFLRAIPGLDGFDIAFVPAQ
jgi:hypothetical protein